MKLDLHFKGFLLNEDHVYLAHKIGDVLTSLQELEQDSQGMGTRHLMASAEGIVQQIRSILHTAWPKTEEKYLPTLQKAGVAIMKAIEDKSDLKGALTSVKTALEKLSTDIGSPQNSLAAPAETPSPVKDSVNPPLGKNEPVKAPATPENT